jgi:hypothetical protein
MAKFIIVNVGLDTTAILIKTLLVTLINAKLLLTDFTYN